jgi:DtxR family transcriptional regulator, Mn-dependent transcriptional regulator
VTRQGFTRSTASVRRGIFIDAREMLLRIIYEFEEEVGVPPRRAALRDRLGITRSAVGQHVARLADDGLVMLSPHNQILLTTAGRAAATVVMRKHRLAERLLVDVIGLDWELSHLEASRWQHVLGERVERRLLRILDDPTVSPYGNPIPGLGELEPSLAGTDGADPGPPLVTIVAAAKAGIGRVLLCRIPEHLQSDVGLLARLRAANLLPGRSVEIVVAEGNAVRAASATGELVLDATASRTILVTAEGEAAAIHPSSGARSGSPRPAHSSI